MNSKLFILNALFLFSTGTLFGADAEFRSWHGQQHALVLGTITNIDDALYTIRVSEALPCAKLSDHHRWEDYNMLPLEHIPSEILVELKDPIYNLLSDSCRLGDKVVISLIKGNKEPYPLIWQRMWHLLRVSDTNKDELRVICDDNRKQDAIAWAIFIRSGADKVVQGFGDNSLTFSDGEEMEITKRIKEIYTISPSDFGTIDTDRYSFLSSLKGAASIGIIGGADGPTAIFIAKKPLLPSIVLLVLIILAVVGLLLYLKKKKNQSKRLSMRKILPEEYPLMENIMYEAIYHPDPANPYPREVIYYPQVRVYWDNWGAEKDDHCLVAVVNNKIAGAVWIRTFTGEIKGCGYIDEQTPEIAIALFEEYRNKGLGTQMMEQMIALMKEKNFKQVSLSITKGNPAIRLYERLGFRVIDENEEDYIMLMGLE